MGVRSVDIFSRCETGDGLGWVMEAKGYGIRDMEGGGAVVLSMDIAYGLAHMRDSR